MNTPLQSVMIKTHPGLLKTWERDNIHRWVLHYIASPSKRREMSLMIWSITLAAIAQA